MRLNAIEKAVVNNPVRAGLQRFQAARWQKKTGIKLPVGSLALEVGCGRGAGVPVILNDFGAGRVHAFDLDPDMVALTRRRLTAHARKTRLWIGSATAIAAAEDTYDAVFEFGILHHVVDWPAAIAEIRRVLKPGGTFWAEEFYARLITHPIIRRLLDHPQQNRFSHHQFVQALHTAGFFILAEGHHADLTGWAVARNPH